ncbi:hypothetical protein OPT61_g6494 [Boeremia exigua]|uniref:Uncharacterized protein n=1 Tax=Boeremia exigua TaxID=749465 RepID=A0ACC2I6E8_9PLEO|nr:hypothetical protein OPT61_g6494 [Boeremia exigua]
MSESHVTTFHARARELAEIPIQKALEEEGQPADEIAEARRSFEIRWVEVDDIEEGAKGGEGKGGEGKGEAGTRGDWVEKARVSYRAMRESGALPSGLDLPVFLCASPAAVASVLRTSPAEVKEAHEGKSRWRSGDVPFLLVAAAETEQGIVEEEDDEAEEEVKVSDGERSWFKPVFKAAAEVLVDELWWVVAEQMMSLGQMTRFVRGATATEEHVTITEEERQGQGGETAVGSGRGEEPGHDDDGLDDIWWTVHTPPRQMRKRRRLSDYWLCTRLLIKRLSAILIPLSSLVQCPFGFQVLEGDGALFKATPIIKVVHNNHYVRPCHHHNVGILFLSSENQPKTSANMLAQSTVTVTEYRYNARLNDVELREGTKGIMSWARNHAVQKDNPNTGALCLSQPSLPYVPASEELKFELSIHGQRCWHLLLVSLFASISILREFMHYLALEMTKTLLSLLSCVPALLGYLIIAITGPFRSSNVVVNNIVRYFLHSLKDFHDQTQALEHSEEVLVASRRAIEVACIFACLASLVKAVSLTSAKNVNADCVSGVDAYLASEVRKDAIETLEFARHNIAKKDLVHNPHKTEPETSITGESGTGKGGLDRLVNLDPGHPMEPSGVIEWNNEAILGSVRDRSNNTSKSRSGVTSRDRAPADVWRARQNTVNAEQVDHKIAPEKISTESELSAKACLLMKVHVSTRVRARRCSVLFQVEIASPFTLYTYTFALKSKVGPFRIRTEPPPGQSGTEDFGASLTFNTMCASSTTSPGTLPRSKPKVNNRKRNEIKMKSSIFLVTPLAVGTLALPNPQLLDIGLGGGVKIPPLLDLNLGATVTAFATVTVTQPAATCLPAPTTGGPIGLPTLPTIPPRPTSTSLSSLPQTTSTRSTTPAPTPTTQPPPNGVRVTGTAQATLSAGAAYQAAILFHHNAARANHGSPPLTWDTSCEVNARLAANTCNSVPYFPAGSTQGQNVFISTSDAFNVTAGITEVWYKGQFQAALPFFGSTTIPAASLPKVSLLTQLLWKHNTKVGCASVDCGYKMKGPGASPSWNKYTVCNYAIRGDNAGLFGLNVGRPVSLTKLGKWTD